MRIHYNFASSDYCETGGVIEIETISELVAFINGGGVPVTIYPQQWMFGHLEEPDYELEMEFEDAP